MPDKELISTETAEQIVKRKRGSKSASVEATTTAGSDEIKQILRNTLYWYKRDIVKSDEECAERLNEFFEHCAETGELPTVEKMCLALGTDRATVWEWQTKGVHGAGRANMIKQAKAMMAAMDAELVQRNKIPQVTYIFRAKNFYGMRDQTDVVVSPSNPVGDAASQKELADKYETIFDDPDSNV